MLMKNRSLKLSFTKDPSPETELVMPAIDPEKIEQIARRSVVDVTKLVVAAAGTLMILRTTLNIIEDKATTDS